MISQIDIEKTLELQPNKECLFVSVATILNHVVDAVNELQKHEEQHLDLLTQLNEMRLHQTKEPTDPYAEQRRWIGKFCKFWDNDDGKTESCGLLDEINEDNCRPFASYLCGNWKHCEPVKPTDSIIYKGE